jgi:hypothetical protein
MRGAIEIPKDECPPGSGSIQRHCIRQAGIGLGESHRARRPTGYNLLHFSVLSHALPPVAGVDGLLGLDFFRGQILTLDFRGGHITLS